MDTHKSVLYSFEGYSVDVIERQTRKGDKVIPLTPKAFETLVVLLENRGHVLDKDFLLNRIWADTYVGEATLAQNISTLRKTFGAVNNGHQLIETVSGRGYRFVGDVQEVSSEQDEIVVERRTSTKFTSEYEEVSGNTETDKSITTRSSVSLTIKSVLRSRSKRMLILGLGAAGLLILTGSFLAFRFAVAPSSFSTSNFKSVTISTLTSDGVTNRVAISPDGKYVAMVKVQNNARSIQVRQLENSSTVEILPPQSRFFRGLTFSPDGKQILYVTFEPLKGSYTTFGTLYRIPMLGGTPEQIETDVDSPVALSPDGRRYAFIRGNPKEKETDLMIGSFDGGTEPQKLAVRNLNTGFSYGGLSWSPDGEIIVCAGFTDEKPRKAEIIAIHVRNGEQNVFSDSRWQWLGQPAWLADGSGLVVAGINSPAANHSEDLWLISYPNGAIRQITNGINSSFSLSLTADSKTIVAVKSTRLSNYWVASAQNTATPVRISQNLTESNFSPTGISWTKDGSILFASMINGNSDIWRMNADGTEKRQITTNDGSDSSPTATPDSRYVIFVSDRSGKSNLWRMKPDGSEPTQLTNELSVSSPSVTPDSQTIYYNSADAQSSRPFLRRININGGESEQLTSQPTMFPKISPDGKYVACYFPQTLPGSAANGDLKLTILEARSGQVLKQFDQLLGQSNMGVIAWSGDKTVLYSTLENDVSKLWELSIEKLNSRLLSESSADSIVGLAYWNEGRKLAFEKNVLVNDAVEVKTVDSGIKID